MANSFDFSQWVADIWGVLAMWIGKIWTSIAQWFQLSIVPIYETNKKWIWFCIFLFLILEIANYAVHYGFKWYIKKNSSIYKEILRINYDYPFYKIPKEVTFNHSVNVRAQFENCDLESYSRRKLKEFDSSLYKFYTSVENNRFQLGSYDKSISRIRDPLLSDGKGKVFQFFFKNYEEEIYKRAMVYPETNPTYHLIVWFRTPAGRHSGKKQYSANHAYMQHLYDKAYGYTQYVNMDVNVDNYRRKVNGVPSREEQKAFEKEQRNRMTPKLRMQILQRDNFTCQYCGKYMPDGVGAQVDHIIPVSKGGISEPRNLQTLCSVCNGRKSNRIENTGNIW